MGFKFSIDDFGMGYTSLLALQELPISSLKLDEKVVDRIPDNTNDAIIIKSIVQLSSNLSLTAIAEGVKTKSQLIFLQKYDCPLGQGLYFCEPVPMDKLIDYLKS